MKTEEKHGAQQGKMIDNSTEFNKKRRTGRSSESRGKRREEEEEGKEESDNNRRDDDHSDPNNKLYPVSNQWIQKEAQMHANIPSWKPKNFIVDIYH